MALLASSTTLSGSLISYIQNPNHSSTQFLSIRNPLFLPQRSLRFSAITVFSVSDGHNPTPSSPSLPPLPENLHSNDLLPPRNKTLKLNSALLHFATSAILFVALSARACSVVSGNPPLVPVTTTCYTASVVEGRNEEIVDGNNGSSLEQNSVKIFSVNTENHITGNSITPENVEDKELQAMLESWKSKTYALTVPLRVVALRGSVPPSWIKDFMQSQGKRLNLRSEFRGSLNDIFLDLTSSVGKGNIEPKSAMAADIVTVGDSWLSLGINKGIFEPIQGAEEQDWFKGLSEKWKIGRTFAESLRVGRNSNGELDSAGKIWAAPYRWGSMVIAYKKNKFQKHNIAPIEDWGDLWRPELAGKIAMIDSPREVVGAVFKYMGASYNTMDIDSQVTGGKNAAMESLTLLQKQVRLFDSVHYLKAFGVGDVWVAVGWSSDVVPAAKRMSNVAVVVPKSGASLWADLWATPAAPRFATSRIGGRVRGPSPLIHQWIDFCLQAARALPFVQEVIPGASPFALESSPMQNSLDLTKDKPKLDTNLIAGVPPPDILAKCEFLEPLSDAALMDYQWLISSMRKPGRGFINSMQDYISSMVQNFRLKPQSK